MQTHFLFFLLSHFVSFWPFNSSAEVSNTLLFYYFLHEKFEIFSMPTFLMNDVGNEIFLAVEILSILCTQGVLIKFTYASHPFASPPIVLRSLLRLIPSFSCPWTSPHLYFWPIMQAEHVVLCRGWSSPHGFEEGRWLNMLWSSFSYTVNLQKTHLLPSLPPNKAGGRYSSVYGRPSIATPLCTPLYVWLQDVTRHLRKTTTRHLATCWMFVSNLERAYDVSPLNERWQPYLVLPALSSSTIRTSHVCNRLWLPKY